MDHEYEILCKYKREAWEHCDYATGTKELRYLLAEYKMAYGEGFTFKYKRVFSHTQERR